MKCDECDHKRTIVSENGYHYMCGLHWKSARYCMHNNYKYFSNHMFFGKIREKIIAKMDGEKE